MHVTGYKPTAGTIFLLRDQETSEKVLVDQYPDTKIMIMLQSCLKESASMLIENMDETVDPCDDFHKFACGRFEQIDIPDDEAVVSSFSLLGDKLKGQVKFDCCEFI